MKYAPLFIALTFFSSYEISQAHSIDDEDIPSIVSKIVIRTTYGNYKCTCEPEDYMDPGMISVSPPVLKGDLEKDTHVLVLTPPAIAFCEALLSSSSYVVWTVFEALLLSSTYIVNTFVMTEE